MPYTMKRDTSQCPTNKPFAVCKEADGKVVPGGCHMTKEDARKHLAALNIAMAKESK